MNFSWTEAQAGRYADALAFARERLDPVIAGRTRRFFGRDEWLLCGDAGLLGLCIPEEHGGQGLDAVTTARAIEGFALGCSDTGLVFSLCAHLFACAMPIAEFGDEDLKRRVLPKLASGEWIGANAITEPEAGSDVFALTGRGTVDDGGYTLDAQKSFVTNAPVADCFLVYVSTNPAHGYLGITGFVVARTTPGVEVGDHFEKVGLTTTPVSGVAFSGCRVDVHDRVGAEGAGAAMFKASMAWERACLFAQYLGVMERQLAAVVEHARSRRQFGQPIGRFQAVSHRVADMKLRLDAARLLLYRACWMHDQGEDATLEIALSKIAVSEGAVQSGVDAIRIFGGAGVRPETGVEQALRDALPGTIFSGTSEIQRDLVARGLGL